MLRINERQLTWAFTLSLLVLAANAFISYRDLFEQTSNTAQVVQSRAVLNQFSALAAAINDAESARRGFLIDGNNDDKTAFVVAANRVVANLQTLKDLTRSRSDRHAEVIRLDETLPVFIAELRLSMGQVEVAGPQRAHQLFEFESIRHQLATIRRNLATIEQSETRWLEARIAERRASISRAFVTFSVASTFALVTIGTTYALVRRSLGERERALQSLRESEARIRLLFDSVGEGIYGIDTAGLCTFCNPAALRLLGFSTQEQVLGKEMHSLIHHMHPDGSPFPAHLCPIYQTIHSGEGVLGIEDFFYRADGHPIPVEYRAHAIRRQGEIQGAVVTFVDIGSKRQAETEMRQRDRALRAIGQGVFISDGNKPGSPIIYANSAFERLTGYGPQDWRGKSLARLQSDEFLGSSGEYTITDWDSQELAVETEARRKDGSSYWQSLTIAPVNDPEFQTNHLVGVITDVSERRAAAQKLQASEERIRLMIESVHDYGIFSINPVGRISSWNPGAERLFGFVESAIIGAATDRLFSSDDRANKIPELELAQARANGRFEAERWHVRSDGTRFLVSGLTTAIRDEKGSLVGYTKIARDITEAKRVETELRRAKEAAESAVRAKSTFLANMGHELRTPLNAVIGYSEMLSEEAAERGVSEFVSDLKRIREAGYLLLKLINNLLDLSKIETGRMEVADETFHIADLVRSVVRSVGPLAEQQGNTIQVIYPADLGTLNADIAKVTQALNHLISNAVKFTEGGTITFRVAREFDDDGQEWVVFTIADDGIGMTRDQVERLFQPFTQGDASAARRYGGTGLGLTISHQFCQMMGGRIDVLSNPGQGSTFTMRLPASGASVGSQ